MLNQSIRLLERTASDLPVSGPPTNHVPQQFTLTQSTSSIRSTSINAEQRLRSSSNRLLRKLLEHLFSLCSVQNKVADVLATIEAAQYLISQNATQVVNQVITMASQ